MHIHAYGFSPCADCAYRFELGDKPPTVEDVNVQPGVVPGADDVYLEFDFTW